MFMHVIVYMLSSKVYDEYLSPRPLSGGTAIIVSAMSGQVRCVLPCQKGSFMVDECYEP